MPTGYTCIINDKKATFEEFVWTCARAFGALIHMRDSSMGATIQRDVPSDYHKIALKECLKNLDRLLKMSEAEATREAQKEHHRREKLRGRE